MLCAAPILGRCGVLWPPAASAHPVPHSSAVEQEQVTVFGTPIGSGATAIYGLRGSGWIDWAPGATEGAVLPLA